jgi:hypothetical protein
MQETLVKIAKKLKKNNVAVDIVSLAAEEENAPKLEAFQVQPLSNLTCSRVPFTEHPPCWLAIQHRHKS